jgi:4-carboxymuconolactone decarboxylase
VTSDEQRREAGLRVRRAVLGDVHVDRAVAGTTEFTAPFQDLITRYAWGDVWSRPGLSRVERSMITLAALVALRQSDELAMHVRAALRNGLTPAQLSEILLHLAVYAGVPSANHAYQVAQAVLAEEGAVLAEEQAGLAEEQAGPAGQQAGPAGQQAASGPQ